MNLWCMLGVHNYSVVVSSQPYEVKGITYAKEKGVRYIKECSRCGVMKSFYHPEMICK